jgi:Fe-S-cluster containining protein
MATSSPTQGKTFFEKADANPCVGCSAPCCRMVLIPHPTPGDYMDLDYMLYMLGFATIQLALNRNGQWQVLVDQPCGFLDQTTNLCTLHNTPRKPKTCVFFNPHRCWYKRNFHNTDNPPEILRINLEAFEVILSRVTFDESDNIVEFPTWDQVKQIVDAMATISGNGASEMIDRDGKMSDQTNPPVSMDVQQG